MQHILVGNFYVLKIKLADENNSLNCVNIDLQEAELIIKTQYFQNPI